MASSPPADAVAHPINLQSVTTLKRLATPEEIAAAITFLASDQARWITGDTLRVDGGSKL